MARLEPNPVAAVIDRRYKFTMHYLILGGLLVLGFSVVVAGALGCGKQHECQKQNDEVGSQMAEAGGQISDPDSPGGVSAMPAAFV